MDEEMMALDEQTTRRLEAWARGNTSELRDRFAMAALPVVAHPHLLARITQSGDVPKMMADAAYKVAAAMMAERARIDEEERKAVEGGSGSTGG